MTAAEEQLVAELAEALNHAEWCNTNYATSRSSVQGCDCLDTHRRPAARALLPVVLADRRRAVAKALDDFAALIDRGPTFPMPPSIFSAMARERAEDARADAVEGGGR